MKSKFWRVALSVAISLVLWMYVISVVSPESDETFYDIPVSFQGEAILEDRGFMLVSEKPTVTLTLHGNRAELNNISFREADFHFVELTKTSLLHNQFDRTVFSIQCFVQRKRRSDIPVKSTAPPDFRCRKVSTIRRSSPMTSSRSSDWRRM